MPGIPKDAETLPIVKYSKHASRVHWVSESEFGTDDELAFKDKKRLNRLKSYKQRCSRHSKKRIAAVLVIPLFILIVFGLVYLYYADAKALGPTTSPELLSPVATTHCGLVRGSIEHASNASQRGYVFKGIPYALPPTEEWRWRSPQGLSLHDGCWNGTLLATQFQSHCPQIAPGTGTVTGDEDCLYLNVWTPSLKLPALLPVLVYIHGGGLTHFSGSSSHYRPSLDTAFALNVVAVSFNYRLNGFGFMTLQCLSDRSTSNSSGNYGFMDQALALDWVHENIAYFGGDPDKVTLFGYEAGATSAMALYQSPLTKNKGFFQKIIAASGPTTIRTTFEEAYKTNEMFLKNSNCTRGSKVDACHCIYNLSTADAVLSFPSYDLSFMSPTDRHFSHFDLPEKGETHAVLAVLEPTTLPKYAAGLPTNDHIPIMIGSTAQEIDVDPFATFREDETLKFLHHLNVTLGSFSQNLVGEALDVYNMSGHVPNQMLYEQMATDVRLACSLDQFAHEIASSDSREVVYRYIVESKPSSPLYNQWYNYSASNSFSGWDVAALFGLDSYTGTTFTQSNNDAAFSRTLRTQFQHFIYYGHPLETLWRLFPSSVAVFNDKGLLVLADQTSKLDAKCNLWKKWNLLDRGWVF